MPSAVRVSVARWCVRIAELTMARDEKPARSDQLNIGHGCSTIGSRFCG